MRIENQFEIPAPPALAWPVLMDVQRTAACFPGTDAIEALGAGQYQGRVTVKLGPLSMVFAGRLRIEDRDDAAFSATLHSQWREAKGRGNALTVTRFALAPHGGGTRVTLSSDLQLAGQVAQYGRGTGMISALSAQLITTFAGNLRANIEAPAAAAPGAKEISGLTLIAKALASRVKP